MVKDVVRFATRHSTCASVNQGSNLTFGKKQTRPACLTKTEKAENTPLTSCDTQIKFIFSKGWLSLAHKHNISISIT